MPAKQKELKEVSTKYSDKSLGNVTVSQVSKTNVLYGEISRRWRTKTQKHAAGLFNPECSYIVSFGDIFQHLQAIGGARDVKCMFWDVSLLDAQEVSKIYGNNYSFSFRFFIRNSSRFRVIRRITPISYFLGHGLICSP